MLTIDEAFWPKVDKRGDDECWQWLGPSRVKGGRLRYGSFSWGGRCLTASRFAYELHYGVSVPRNLDVCHSCDTPLCVNPNHLFVGTRSDNMRDAVAKGRKTPATRKLVASQVREIHRLVRSGISSYAIAPMFGINPSQVSNIKSGYRWRSVWEEFNTPSPSAPAAVAA